MQAQQKLYGQLMTGKELDSRVRAATKLQLRPPRGFAAPKQPRPGLSAAKLPAAASSTRWKGAASALPMLCCSEQRQRGQGHGQRPSHGSLPQCTWEQQGLSPQVFIPSHPCGSDAQGGAETFASQNNWPYKRGEQYLGVAARGVEPYF